MHQNEWEDCAFVQYLLDLRNADQARRNYAAETGTEPIIAPVAVNGTHVEGWVPITCGACGRPGEAPPGVAPPGHVPICSDCAKKLFG